MAEIPALPGTPAVVLDDQELAALEHFAVTLARVAAPAALAHFRRPVPVTDKSGGGAYDPVTEADRSAETAVRAHIRAHHPDHGIFGEEHGHEPGRGGLTWVVDPIDGTRAYITGQLHWGILVALYDGEKPVLGVVHQPFTNELFVGCRLGAWHARDGARTALATRTCPRLSDATLCATSPSMFRPGAERDAFDRLASVVRMLRYGGDCYSYCMLAHGLVDLVVEADLAPYDVQAVIAVVEAAGGVCTSWEGGSAAHGGRIVAAGDRQLHARALAALQGA